MLHRTMYSKRYRSSLWCSLASVALVAALWVCAAAPGVASSPRTLHTLLKLGSSEGVALLHRFRLPLAGLRVAVVDLDYTRPLAAALGGANLVVNGGYWGFRDERTRMLIGLLYAGGKQLSPLRDRLDGGVLTLRDGRASISPSRGYKLPHDADLALQCSPRLVVSRAVVPSLNASARSARTAACVRNGGKTLDIYLTDPQEQGATLEQLAHWLLSDGCDYALNLDGGSSSAAAFRDRGEVVRLGAGERLPYALRFDY